MSRGKNFYYLILGVEGVGEGILPLSSGGCVESKNSRTLGKEGLSN